MDALTGPVWITRAAPGAAGTAERLRAVGFTPLVDPLLETRDIDAGAIDLAKVGALAFTSVNAIAAFARQSDARALPAYAVGDATAAAARAAGFADVRAGAGDSTALARLIAADPRRSAGLVLHPSAGEVAGDLAGDLERAGVPARRLVIYETVVRRPSPQALAALPELAAILLHSPKAARVLAEALVEVRSPSPLAAVLCLSPAIADAFREVGGSSSASWLVRAASTPSDEALLSLLESDVCP